MQPFYFPQWSGMFTAVLQVQLVVMEQIYLFFCCSPARETPLELAYNFVLESSVHPGHWKQRRRGLETQQGLMIREMVSGLEDLDLVAWDELLSPCHSLVSDVGRRRTQLDSKAQVMTYLLLYHTVSLNKHTQMILWEVRWPLMVYLHLTDSVWWGTPDPRFKCQPCYSESFTLLVFTLPSIAVKGKWIRPCESPRTGPGSWERLSAC